MYNNNYFFEDFEDCDISPGTAKCILVIYGITSMYVGATVLSMLYHM